MKKTLRPGSAVLVLGVVLLLACEDPVGLPSGFVGSDEVGQIVMGFGADPLRFPRDPYVLDSAWITRDTLRFRVTHGGGCERHGYALVAWNGWLESKGLPPAGVPAIHWKPRSLTL